MLYKVKIFKIFFLGITLAISLGISLLIGPIPFQKIIEKKEILVLVRIPRIILVILVGSSLSASGMCLQALFRNPLASPYILGISSASAFGACLALLFKIPIVLTSFLFGLFTIFLLYILSKKVGDFSGESLILIGIAINVFYSALVSFLIYLSGEKISQIIFWLMGGFWMADWSKILYSFCPIILSLFILTFFMKELNIISTGEESALDLGVEVIKVKKTILFFSSLLIASSVSVSGTIGFVGLIVPHLMRFWIGEDHRFLYPGTLMGGAILLLWADNLSRCMLLSGEIPVGIYTSFIGVPFFIYLLLKKNE